MKRPISHFSITRNITIWHRPAMPKIISADILLKPAQRRFSMARTASSAVWRRFIKRSTSSSKDCIPRLIRLTEVRRSASIYSGVRSSGLASRVISSIEEQSKSSRAWFMSISMSWGLTSDGVPPPKYIELMLSLQKALHVLLPSLFIASLV